MMIKKVFISLSYIYGRNMLLQLLYLGSPFVLKRYREC